MNQTPAQQWTALSALYEEADALTPSQLKVWLADLRRQGNPLLLQLQRMLEARAQFETDEFLLTLPKFVDDTAAVSRSQWAVGSRIGAYRLIRPLGEGGMAEVWLAERDDGAFTRRVAVKLPFARPGREGLAARFDRERDILASLRHSHIAGLLDAGVTAQGQAWLALEYVEGEPLSVYCDRRRLPVRGRVALFRQVLLAVQHAHANLVIHRDLKPGNILVTARGEARLLDFGIAKLLETEGGAIAETELTRDEGRTLTPRYASPEQLNGHPLTIGCDVYALGVVLYELLSGERPYELKTESVAQLEVAILDVEPRAPSRRTGNEALAADRGSNARQLRRALSPELDAIILRCLRKGVVDRYSSVDALLADVDRWLTGEAVLARSPSRWYRFGKFALRHRLGMAAGSAGLIMLIAMTSVATLFGLHAREESARAVASRDFMLELFRGADREKSRGADITARELLQTGRRDVLSQLSEQPRLQTELLSGIASIQFDMGEYASAGSTFEDVARVASTSGQTEVLGMALAGEADTAMRLGDFKRATELLDRARSESRPAARGGSFAEAGDAAVRIATVEGWIAAFSERPDAARRSFGRARDLAARDHGPAAPEALSPLRGAIYVERVQLQYDKALALQHELEAIVRGQPHPKPRELAALAYRSSDLTYAAGRYSQGWLALSQASVDCAGALGPNDEVCRRMVLGKLKARMRMGFADADPEAMRMVDSMAEDAEMPVDRADALYVLLRIASAGGPTSRLQALTRRIESLVDAPDGASGVAAGTGLASGFAGGAGSASNRWLNPADRVKLAVGLAEAALMVGDVQLASRRAARALTLEAARGPNLQPTPWSATAMLVEAISTRLAGRPEASLQRLTLAQESICRQLGPVHPMCRIFQLDMAVLLADLGRSGEAMDIVRREQSVIEASFGVQSPLNARLLAFEKVLALRLASPAPSRPVDTQTAILPYVFI